MQEKQISVLIVEDEGVIAADLQQTLGELGYDAFAIASSADEAIKCAADRCPDVVLMDIRIKGKRDGIETAEILKSQFGVALVYLTAHSDEATLARAKKTEPHGYLLKPVRPAELKSAIEVSFYKYTMEKRLRESQQWYASTLHSIGDAVVTVDLASRVTFMNHAAEVLIGLKAEDAIGKPTSEVLRLLDLPSEEPLAKALRENRGVELVEANLQNIATGEKRLISDSAAPVISEGATLGAVMVFRDITAQKLLQKKLEFVDRLTSLGTMAAGVAHEINNPLSVVIGNLDFVLKELPQLLAEIRAGSSGKAWHRLEEISLALSETKPAALRIGRIVSDMRAFSRPHEPSVGLVNLHRCLEWTLSTTSQELQHRARLTTKLGETPLVRADESQLGQVFVNLLLNATQAISPGKVAQNEVGVSTYTNAEGSAVIEISDTGSGIPSDLVKRIFEPFFTTKPVGEGTGLGLSICHGIVASFGGEITVESEVGRGTTFRVTLPAAAPPEQSIAPAAPITTDLHGRILLIDDEEMIVRVLKRVLRDHEVISAGSAQEALSLIKQGEKFDIIFSDLIMPTMTGREFYEELLALEPDLARRIVFLTGGALTAQLDAFLHSIPNLLIEKPFTAAKILEAIQQLLVKRS